jgi:hypothetical protein
LDSVAKLAGVLFFFFFFFTFVFSFEHWIRDSVDRHTTSAIKEESVLEAFKKSSTICTKKTYDRVYFSFCFSISISILFPFFYSN